MTVFIVPPGRAAAPMTLDLLGILRRARSVLADPDGLAALGPWVPEGVLHRWTPERARALASEEGTDAASRSVALVPGPGREPDSTTALASALERQGHAVRTVDDTEAPALHLGEHVPLVGVESWVAQRPLLGWSVVVTRPEPQAEGLVRSLQERGARAVRFPVIRIVPPDDPGGLRRAISGLDRYDWILFTSANGVRAFREHLLEAGLDARAFAGKRVGAIGPATAEALLDLGIRTDVLPGEFVAESLLEALAADGPWDGVNVLLPRAREARDVLPEGLTRLGASVDVVEAYRTEAVHPSEGTALRTALEAGEVDLVTFTASSTVRAFVGAVGTLGRARAVAIGPVTADTVREAGLPLAAVASPFTTAGLLDACEELAAHEGG